MFKVKGELIRESLYKLSMVLQWS